TCRDPTKRPPSAWIETVSCPSRSGRVSGVRVSGRATFECERSGVTTMKMMSSTRQTSTSGVTLMSLLIPAIESPNRPALRRMGLTSRLGEQVAQLRGDVVHLDPQARDAVGQDVEHPGGGNGDEKTEGG